VKKKYRSKFESDTARKLRNKGIPFEYEQYYVEYIPPPRRYTPDFRLPNGIFIETKGRFVSSDRAKHLLIKDQHPELDIRFLFMNPNNKLSKKSKTTYAEWCDKHGFKWAKGPKVPNKWLQ
jgi:hypothetical protein